MCGRRDDAAKVRRRGRGAGWLGLQMGATAWGAGEATCIGDLDLEQFEDLSGGRSTCLKKVEVPGDEDCGNPTTGSKVRWF